MLLPIRGGQLEERREFKNTGIRDDDIDRSERFFRAIDPSLNARAIRDVHTDRDGETVGEFASNAIGRVRIAVGDRDARAGSGHRNGDPASDTPAAARDECMFAAQRAQGRHFFTFTKRAG